MLQQLVNEQAMIAEADRLGMTVTDDEVRQRILAMPEFQLNGQFIGEAQYQAMLNTARPPMTPGEFEAGLRRQLLVEKLRAVVTDWVAVTDAEADAEYTRRNEKVKVQLVHVPSSAFLSQATATDAEMAAYFDVHKEDYRVGERRKVRYVLVDVEALRQGIIVPSREVERYYNDNIELFSTPEQVRASHILLKTEGKDEAAVRAAAEKVLQEAKAGADFAELAKKYSEDESNAKLGGDLDYFARGRMVPEFDEAAFAAQPGLIPDLVKTELRLPHHQGRRQEGRHDAHLRRGQGPDSRAARRRARAAPGRHARRRSRPRRSRRRPISTRWRRRAAGRWRRPASSPPTSRSSASAPRRRCRPRSSR